MFTHTGHSKYSAFTTLFSRLARHTRKHIQEDYIRAIIIFIIFLSEARGVNRRTMDKTNLWNAGNPNTMELQ